MPKSCDGLSIGSTCLDIEPPNTSRLAQSLKRGHFSETFGEWSVLGRGGFGTVVKAWHLTEKRWYAVKLIQTRLRAEETIEDVTEAWCGQEIFNQLRGLRSPHVVKYVRYWSEMPSDVPCVTPTSPGPSPKIKHAKPPPMTIGGFDDSSTDCCAWDVGPTQNDGFDWADHSATPRRTRPAGLSWAEDCPSSDERDQIIHTMPLPSPKATYYTVTILEQMEFCEGITLATWLSHPELRPRLAANANPDTILELFSQIVRGLTALHAAGLVHCDVKPSNIMITTPGAQVKFFDFGTAKLKSGIPQRRGSRAPLSPDDQEDSYTALGTPGYAPPEHCFFRSTSPCGVRPGKFSRQDSRSSCEFELSGGPAHTKKEAGSGADIFSAGVILVELLMATASRGAAWLTAMEKAKALQQVRTGHGALPDAVVNSADIHGWLRQLVLRMVVWDADVRPSAREVLDELEVGLWKSSRHNPNIGACHPRRPMVARSAAHSPYVGFFLDHRCCI